MSVRDRLSIIRARLRELVTTHERLSLEVLSELETLDEEVLDEIRADYPPEDLKRVDEQLATLARGAFNILNERRMLAGVLLAADTLGRTLEGAQVIAPNTLRLVVPHESTPRPVNVAGKPAQPAPVHYLDVTSRSGGRVIEASLEISAKAGFEVAASSGAAQPQSQPPFVGGPVETLVVSEAVRIQITSMPTVVSSGTMPPHR